MLAKLFPRIFQEFLEKGAQPPSFICKNFPRFSDRKIKTSLPGPAIVLKRALRSTQSNPITEATGQRLCQSAKPISPQERAYPQLHPYAIPLSSNREIRNSENTHWGHSPGTRALDTKGFSERSSQSSLPTSFASSPELSKLMLYSSCRRCKTRLLISGGVRREAEMVCDPNKGTKGIETQNFTYS